MRVFLHGESETYVNDAYQYCADHLPEDIDVDVQIGSISDTDKQNILTVGDVVALEVRADNEQDIGRVLGKLSLYGGLLSELSPPAAGLLVDLANGYEAAGRYDSLRKLFGYALTYATEDQRMRPTGQDSFVVYGNHGKTYDVARTLGSWCCGCDLFNGRNGFEADECSHIQAAMLRFAGNG